MGELEKSVLQVATEHRNEAKTHRRSLALMVFATVGFGMLYLIPHDALEHEEAELVARQTTLDEEQESTSKHLVALERADELLAEYREDLEAHPICVAAHLGQGGVGKELPLVLRRSGHVGAVMAIGRHVVKYRRERSIPGTIGVGDSLRTAHIGRDMRIDPHWVVAEFLAHGTRELEPIELGDGTGE